MREANGATGQTSSTETSTETDRPRLAAVRTRWAAIGAAVAVTLGAGTLATVDAVTSSGERTSYTAIEGCRLMDTRDAFQVGPRSAALGSNDTATVAARGTQGNCTPDDLPDDALALQLNVTAVGATMPTFLSITPDGASDTSSLNPTPGAAPTPNAVTVRLAGDGTFKIFNRQGEVDVIVDVAGFYTDHDHDDRYYTKAQVDDRLDPLERDSVFIPPIAFQLSDGAGWSIGEFVWNHNGAIGCISAPVDLPAGRTVASVDLTYFAAAVAEVDVLVFGVSAAAGVSTDEQLLRRYLLDGAMLPTATPATAIATLIDDPAAEPGLPQVPTAANAPATIQICTADTLTVTGIGIELAPA